MTVKLRTLFFVASGILASAVFSEGFEVTEKVLEGDEAISSTDNKKNNEQNNENLASSTTNNDTTHTNNWSSAPQPQDLHRIITPVVITSPHADRHQNFSASPMLDATYDTDYYQHNHEHQAKAVHNHHYSSQEEEDGKKTHQYSQPLPPDMFLAQQYLKLHQQKEQDRSNKQKFPRPVIPEAKSNGYNFNSDSISYKPLKFDTDIPSTSFTSDKGGSYAMKGGSYDSKEVPFQYKLPTPVQGNTHPYPYQSPYLNGETELESPTAPSKQHHLGNWADGYKTAVTHQEGEKTSMWKKVLNMLTAFIPLGLFLAALPPNILTINTTQPDLPSRQRSVDEQDSAVTFPILDLLDKYGIDSLDDPDCENRIFCEMSRLGGEPSGNIIQKAFWHLAHDISDKTADDMGMKELFKAVRTDACEIYRCKEKTSTVTTTPQLKEEKE